MSALTEIQAKLKCPKSQWNSFGKYNYRNCEDILEAVKPLVDKAGGTLTVTDEIVHFPSNQAPQIYDNPKGEKVVVFSDRFYVKATATFTDKAGTQFSAVGWAREEDSKKGMDSAMLSGATSSYARKYALNGLFLIDDTKDSDNEANIPEEKNTGTEYLTDSEVQELIDRIKKFSVDEAAFCVAMKVANIRLIPRTQFSFAKGALDKKGAQAKK